MKKYLLMVLTALTPIIAHAATPTYGVLEVQNALSELSPNAAQARNNLGAASVAALTAETTRAETSENTNSMAIAAEVIRAEAVEALDAPLASPTFTGIPNVPTAVNGTNTTQAASTAYVNTALAALADVTSFDNRYGPVTLTTADVIAALNFTPAPIASPSFTGTVTASNLKVTAYEANSSATALATAGTGTIASATPLANSINVITTCSAGAVALPTAAPLGAVIKVFNRCGAAFSILPDSLTDTIENGVAGAGVSSPPFSDDFFTRVSATQWLQ